MRCGTPGTSGHVTAKSSIRDALCLTPGGLPCALGRRVRPKLAEGRAIGLDRMGEFSRGHSKFAFEAERRPERLRGLVSWMGSAYYTGTECGGLPGTGQAK
jgi:hypothetical protein